MHFQVEFIKCPSCRRAVDMHFMYVTTLLGPPEVQCHWCGQVVKTDRIEWWKMDWQAKAWFFGVSLLYVVLAWFLGGQSTMSAWHLSQTGQWKTEWALGESTFWIGGFAWVVIVAMIQLYRIVASLERQTAITPKPLLGSIWNFQIGGQVKVLFLIFLIPMVCWLIALLRDL